MAQPSPAGPPVLGGRLAPQGLSMVLGGGLAPLNIDVLQATWCRASGWSSGCAHDLGLIFHSPACFNSSIGNGGGGNWHSPSATRRVGDMELSSSQVGGTSASQSRYSKLSSTGAALEGKAGDHNNCVDTCLHARKCAGDLLRGRCRNSLFRQTLQPKSRHAGVLRVHRGEAAACATHAMSAPLLSGGATPVAKASLTQA